MERRISARDPCAHHFAERRAGGRRNDWSRSTVGRSGTRFTAPAAWSVDLTGAYGDKADVDAGYGGERLGQNSGDRQECQFSQRVCYKDPDGETSPAYDHG